MTIQIPDDGNQVLKESTVKCHHQKIHLPNHEVNIHQIPPQRIQQKQDVLIKVVKKLNN